MIERTHRGYLVSCDHCSTEQEMKVDSPEHLVPHMIDKGWRVASDGRGEVVHICPCCVEDAPVQFQPQSNYTDSLMDQ